MSKRIQKRPTLKIKFKKVSLKYDNIFHAFDDLIDFNECANLITDQTKLDTQQINNHKLALLTRKNETKHDTATFLTATCFNPVKSIMLQSIKNNYFTAWHDMD